MATEETTPAKKAPAKKPASTTGKKSSTFHGVPKPVLYVGGGITAFVGYKWWKARKAASASAGASTNAASASPCAGTSPYGGGSGGGGGGWQPPTPPVTPLGAPVSPTPCGAPSPGPAPASPDVAPAPAAPAPAPFNAPGAPEQANQPAQQGAPTPSSGVPVGSFKLPNGVLDYQPTAAVSRNGQVAYGLPNVATAEQAKKLGGTVESGADLMKKGWTNLTAGALYLLR